MAKQTMQQIADHLGVSRITVSKVINGRGRSGNVAPQTERRILDYLNEVGYVRSRQAVFLRKGPPQATGILHCGHLYSHLVEAFNLMTDRFVESPPSVEIVVVKPTAIVDGVRELVSRGVSKLVWIYTSGDMRDLARLKQEMKLLSNARTVIYNYPFVDSHDAEQLTAQGLRLVGFDRRGGARKLGEMLKSLGHTRVGLPQESHGPMHASTYMPLGLGDAGLDLAYCLPSGAPTWSQETWGSQLPDAVMNTMRQTYFTAACFADDEVAIHCMNALIKRGVRVPEDLSITGLDGVRWTQAMRPRLTTLRVPVTKMVDCVERILTDAEAGAIHKFDLELWLGDSHGAPCACS